MRTSVPERRNNSVPQIPHVLPTDSIESHPTPIQSCDSSYQFFLFYLSSFLFALLRLGLVVDTHGCDLFPVATLLELLPCAGGPLAVRHEAQLREAVDEHLRRVELRAHTELGCGVVEGVLVVPAYGRNRGGQTKGRAIVHLSREHRKNGYSVKSS